MRKLVARLDSDPLVVFFLFWAIVFGGLVRLYPVLSGDFPLNDGGLFYVMVEDLKAANYRLPLYTTYNNAMIPFAYPPLPFYFAAALSDIFDIPLLQIFRWLPVLLTIATIPAFNLLSKAFLRSRRQAALATALFAMLPPSYDWLIMGGGLTRSLGFLFCILSLHSLRALFVNRTMKRLFCTIVFAAVVVLCHPEAALHTFFASGMLWWFFGRNKASVLSGFCTIFGVALLTAPWWMTIMNRHGWAPVTAAAQTGWHSWLFWTPLLTLTFTREPFLGLVAVLGSLGTVYNLSKKDLLLPVWLLLPFLIEPRNVSLYAIMPTAMLASIVVDSLLLRGVTAAEDSAVDSARDAVGWSSSPSPLRNTFGKALIGFVLIYTLINSLASSVSLATVKVSTEERAALGWIMENTPESANFLVLTYGEWFDTSVQEWFPALSHRVCLTTVQGSEWLPENQFSRRKEKDYPALQKCLFEDVECIEDWASERGYAFDYVYVYQRLVGATDEEASELRLGQWLVHTMKDSPDYTSVYDTPDIKIFAHNRN